MTISTDMLAAFVKVAELNNVSKAAADLGVTKSVVSKRIAQLEHTLQSTLFSRSTRRIALTPAGIVYLESARGVLSVIEQAGERVRDLRQELSGAIHVTAPVSWGQQVLARLIAQFIALHPAIEIDLLLDDRCLDLAFDGIDIALRMSPSHPPEMLAIPLFDLDWVMCASTAYLSANGRPTHPRDLGQRPCISYWRMRSDQDWMLTREGETLTVRVHGPMRANNPEAVREGAIAGMGIALLPRYICDADIAAGRLDLVLPDWVPETKFGTQIYAVAPTERLRLARTKCFLDFLQTRLSANSLPT